MTVMEYRKRERRMGDDLITAYQVLALWVLHDKFGFGKARLLRFQEELKNSADSVAKKYLTHSDILKTLSEETKMDWYEWFSIEK